MKNLTKISSGNIHNKPNGDRGWILGDFKDHHLPYPFFSTKFSVKWARLKKGAKKDSAKSDPDQHTLTILVVGKQRVDFPENENCKSYLLEKEGDYVFFEPGTSHSWEAIDDNLTITFRWKAESSSE